MNQSSASGGRDTIAALSTAPGRAAIAVIRISGPQAGATLDALAGARPAPRRASFRALRHPRTSEVVDQGVALWLPGPASATGEDLCELQIHGGRATVAATLDAVLSVEGVRMAEPGEFTRRAFLSGRMDLAEVEGLADLLSAETENQRRQALLQSSGALSARIEGWREQLISAMALVEAGIDFSDEGEVTEHARSLARDELSTLAGDMNAALADTRAERLRDGFRVAIVGRSNAGKSSLLNALARREAAIVAAEPGTTRDVIEVHLDLEGLPVILVDTAGIRDAGDAAEREGVRRAGQQAAAADLVLWLEDPADRAEPEVGGTVWRVTNKIDLADQPFADTDHRISARTGAGLDVLISAIAAAARDALSSEDVGVTRARHRDALRTAVASLDRCLSGWDDLADEIVAELLRRAAEELGRITGRVGVEDVLDKLFASFCIGK
ncbi:tRNA uridine-5-carboxymethylaminomethyl(34) synthesis GTPase MnmE [Hansschlegelia plantiphila]|uniref:tRNA modification GTPase MnmE n=1 Tax=Hansschlegelia plantiphila TaxID=374655 RepID=A0A9W6MWH4_9HYPH|nr:tRNA uridine-5-carboxymethylaminomethyl(34) synthesis GTPase MnmE [Hansschlegelia plantiphila]GLK68860.1 tRNA modification GTPase MnmE [Hansschlegelia plantiphila]